MTAALDRFERYPLLLGPSPVHPLERLTEHLGGASLWAKRDDVSSGLAFGGNKTRKLEYLVAEALGAGLRHARLDRRRAVEPHAAGGRRRRPRRTLLRARPGELGRLAGRRLRPRREHPPVADPRRRGADRPGRVRHRLQGELGAGARRRRGARRQAVRDPGRRVRPPAGRPRLRALGAGGGRAGGGARRLLRHRDRLLGDGLDPGGDGGRLRRAGAAAPRDRDRRLGEAARDARAGDADRAGDRRADRGRA